MEIEHLEDVENVEETWQVRPVGRVRSSVVDLAAAPNQGDEGAPNARLVLHAAVSPAMRGLEVGQTVVVLTWLDQADRNVLEVNPRGDLSRPLQGVFNTRSPARPNPIGLHEVEILEIDDASIRVSNMEAIDGTPILDIKPVLPAIPER